MAQPQSLLERAVQHLVDASNYSWRESRVVVDKDGGRKVVPYAFGRTAVDGFTFATLHDLNNLRVAFFDRYASIKTETGWRRADELSNTDIDKLIPGRGQDYPGFYLHVRIVQHSPLHEVLRAMATLATNVREESGLLVGHIESRIARHTLEEFMRRGVKLHGWPDPRFARESDKGTPSGPPLAVFRVTLADGKISKVAIEMNRPLPFGEGQMVLNYHFDLQEIGTTKIEIEPAVRDTFFDVLAGLRPRRAGM